MKGCCKTYDKIMKYFKAHPVYNSVVHVMAGIGLGLLLARPLIDHPVKWGVGLIVVAVLAHLYPLMKK